MDKGADGYRRYLAGDDGGLSDIIGEYRDGLIFYLNGFVNDLQTAEELAEDVFVRLAVKKPVFRERSSFKTWLYAIGRNEALSFLRRKKASYVPLDTLPELPDTGGQPETGLIKDERDRELHRLLAGLKSEYHRVLWLYYFENMPTRDIALVMKKSVHGTETLLYRARQALQRELEREGYDREDL